MTQPDIKPHQLFASHEGRKIHILFVDLDAGIRYLEESLYGTDVKYMSLQRLLKDFTLQGEAKATLADLFTVKEK